MPKKPSHARNKSTSSKRRARSNGSKKATGTLSPKKKTTSTQDKKAFKPTTRQEIIYENAGNPAVGGRLHREWIGSRLIPMYAKLRKGPVLLPESYKYWDHRYLMNYFSLKGWQFGNWVTQEDRFNYVCATGIALFDLAKVLKFRNKDIGLFSKITMAIGARGMTSARAHFEPWSYAINITRFEDNPSDKEIGRSFGMLTKFPKEIRFQFQGGVGALAHEYGHAIDYWFGGFVDKDAQTYSLSGGDSVRTRLHPEISKQKGLRGKMENLLNALIWKDYPNRIHTEFYQSTLDYRKKYKIKSQYLIERCELFARAFEQYVGYCMKRRGMANAFLHQPKYDQAIYMPSHEVEKIAPLFDGLISQMRTELKRIS